MTAYELMVKTNHYLIKEPYTPLNRSQKDNIINQLLKARSTPEEAQRFYKAVNFSGNTDSSGRRMYPVFFIPPYNQGHKYKTILGQTPKTHILSANMYELEILRLLHLLDPHNTQVSDMVSKSLDRLKTTCFGYCDDGVGECFDSSLVVLRFLATVLPNDHDWLHSRIDNYNKHFGEKHRPWFVKWYYRLCLSELPLELAEPEIVRHKDEILSHLNKSCVMNSETDKTIHPVLVCILRNVISRLPDYVYLKERHPFINEKDGRLYFNTEKYAF